jgi:hypothetical protein
MGDFPNVDFTVLYHAFLDYLRACTVSGENSEQVKRLGQENLREFLSTHAPHLLPAFLQAAMRTRIYAIH